MPNICSFCRIKKPPNHLILPTPVGIQWLEFCEPCGNYQEMQSMTDEGLLVKTVREIFDDTAQERREREQI